MNIFFFIFRDEKFVKTKQDENLLQGFSYSYSFDSKCALFFVQFVISSNHLSLCVFILFCNSTWQRLTIMECLQADSFHSTHSRCFIGIWDHWTMKGADVDVGEWCFMNNDDEYKNRKNREAALKLFTSDYLKQKLNSPLRNWNECFLKYFSRDERYFRFYFPFLATNFSSSLIATPHRIAVRNGKIKRKLKTKPLWGTNQ